MKTTSFDLFKSFAGELDPGVLQNNEVKPLGSTNVIHVDVRIVSATNRDIRKMVAENTFRQKS